MSGIRPIIDGAVAQVLSEHPKYFTELGVSDDRARKVLVRKIMSAIRGDGSDKSSAPDSTPPAPAQAQLVDPKGREGRAYLNLCLLSGAVAPFRTSEGKFVLPVEAANDAVFALADLPAKDKWLFLTELKNMTAWREFFRETMPPGSARRSIVQELGGKNGYLMPWPWPPSKTGVVYAPNEESEVG